LSPVFAPGVTIATLIGTRAIARAETLGELFGSQHRVVGSPFLGHRTRSPTNLSTKIDANAAKK
jgi:hypothetical protein